MALVQRLFLLAFLPVLGLLGLRSLFPTTYEAAIDHFQDVLSITPLGPLIPGLLVPRSNIHLVFSSVSHWSHHEKFAKIALPLANLGYPITFITGRIFESDVRSLHPNINYHAMSGKDDKLTPAEYEELKTFVPGSPEQRLYFMKKVMIETMPDQLHTLQSVMTELKSKDKDIMVVSVFDVPVMGQHPVLMGANGVKPDANLGVSCHPIMLDSNDTFPSYTARKPATGPDARAIHARANQGGDIDFVTREISNAYWDQVKRFGATRKENWHIYHAMQSVPQHLMAMGVPEFQFPRSDLRDNVHFFGAVKPRRKGESGKDKLPSWWGDVERAKAEGKKIVAVSQGTIAPDMKELLIPTLEALRDREDVLVVATTVSVEPEALGVEFPVNARVAKFVPYDVLMPITDVLINNGGYGAVMQSLNLGVPLVVAGTGQDKDLTNIIVEMKEVGVNLGRSIPTVEKIREGAAKVLDEAKYKVNAIAMRGNFARYDSGVVFDQVIQTEARKWAKEKERAK